MAIERAYKTGVSIKTKNKHRVAIQTKNGTYETKRKNYNKNKIKRESISELQNPDVVYMLGGIPTYIHSTEAYFRAGVKTAEIEMNKMLEALVKEQKGILLERANYIDNRWKEALEILGIEEDYANAFNTFRNLWIRFLNSSSVKEEYLAALIELTKLKQATTLMNEVNKNISEIRDSLKNDSSLSGQERAAKFNSKLNHSIKDLGLNIEVSFNKQTGNYSYGGEQLTELKKILKQTARNSINYALQHTSNKSQMETILKLMNSHIHADLVRKTGSVEQVIDYLDSKDIGNLFDMFGDNIMHINEKDLDIFTDKITDILIKPVAPEKKLSNDKKRSTITDKNDALIQLLSQGIAQDVVISIPISNKTGSIIQRYSNQVDNKTLSFIDRFTASIESAHLDFSNIESTSRITQSQQGRLMALFNYVLRNDAAFAGQQSFIEPFKEMMACYIGWLKIVTEIIGNPQDPLDYCMAIRTPNNLYNTADIMRKFINLSNPLDIIRGEHYMNVTELKRHFYKRGLNTKADAQGKIDSGALSPGFANYLYDKKRHIIVDLVSKNKKVSYYNLYNSDLQSTLKNLAANTLKLPSLKTWFQINLDNIGSVLDI